MCVYPSICLSVGSVHLGIVDYDDGCSIKQEEKADIMLHSSHLYYNNFLSPPDSSMHVWQSAV